MKIAANGFAKPLSLRSATWRLLLAVALVMAYALVAIPANATGSGGIELLDDDDDGWASAGSGISLTKVIKTVDADEFWEEGYDGSGVDIAVIDSGVLPIGPLAGDKVIFGPDLSFESQADNLRHLDTYGHGTHLAAIIAGFEPGDDWEDDYDDWDEDGAFLGIAPGSRIVSVKVADSDGAVDVTQVIAGIDWVVEHRNDNGLNIRVLNLSFGTDGVQPHEVDPLHFAVERAWNAGIVVVAAAGNDGNSAQLRNPAADPFVIAVGASDSNGTTSASDDSVASFSNCGTAARHVDVVAPGKSLKSLRAPGSSIDVDHPEAVVGSDLFKGSGTSQAAAVVSGAAALIIDQRPSASPDEVKALLMDTARPISGLATCQGAGLIDLSEAEEESTPSNAAQGHAKSKGTGSIDLARGSHRVADNGTAISGEVDIFGNEFNGASWSMAAAAGASWSGGNWNGASWSGASWSGASWSGASWSGASWSGASWSSKTWSGASWSGASWSGASWSGASWSGASWSGSVWSGLSWN